MSACFGTVGWDIPQCTEALSIRRGLFKTRIPVQGVFILYVNRQ